MKKRLLGMFAALVLCSALCVNVSAETDFTGWDKVTDSTTLTGENSIIWTVM